MSVKCWFINLFVFIRAKVKKILLYFDPRIIQICSGNGFGKHENFQNM